MNLSKELLSTNPFVNVDSISSRIGRGPTWGKDLEKYIKAHGKMTIKIRKEKGRSVSYVQSFKLSSELGIISWKFIPVPTKWKDINDQEKNETFEHLY